MKNLIKHNGKTNSTIMEHNAFLRRIKKTLYYGSPIPKYECISRPMAEYAADIFSETHKGHSLNRLNFVTAGKLNVAPCSLILAIIYLDRLKDFDPEYARKITPTELFLISMMVSTKFYCGYDESIYLSDYAEIGDISVEALKQMELDFLYALNWKVYVSNEQFFEKLKKLELSLAKQQSLRRGWLTYTEMLILFPSFNIIKEFVYFNLVLAFSYAIGIITIASAFLIASHVPGTLLYSRNTADLGSITATTTDLQTSSDNNLTTPNAATKTTASTLSSTIDSEYELENVLLNDNDEIFENSYKLFNEENNIEQKNECILINKSTIDFHLTKSSNEIILNQSLLFVYKKNYENLNFWNFWSHKKFII